jgi:hypothetical protein
LREPGWIARAAAEVPAEWFETPALREVYEALRRSPENVGSPVFLEQLTPEAVRAWNWLGSIERKYGAPDPDQNYVDACRTLEARPLRRRLEEVTRRKREVTAEEFEGVIQEEHRLKQQLATIFPEELLKRHMRRGRRDAR